MDSPDWWDDPFARNEASMSAPENELKRNDTLRWKLVSQLKDVYEQHPWFDGTTLCAGTTVYLTRLDEHVLTQETAEGLFGSGPAGMIALNKTLREVLWSAENNTHLFMGRKLVFDAKDTKVEFVSPLRSSPPEVGVHPTPVEERIPTSKGVVPVFKTIEPSVPRTKEGLLSYESDVQKALDSIKFRRTGSLACVRVAVPELGIFPGHVGVVLGYKHWQDPAVLGTPKILYTLRLEYADTNGIKRPVDYAFKAEDLGDHVEEQSSKKTPQQMVDELEAAGELVAVRPARRPPARETKAFGSPEVLNPMPSIAQMGAAYRPTIPLTMVRRVEVIVHYESSDGKQGTKQTIADWALSDYDHFDFETSKKVRSRRNQRTGVADSHIDLGEQTLTLRRTYDPVVKNGEKD